MNPEDCLAEIACSQEAKAIGSQTMLRDTEEPPHDLAVASTDFDDIDRGGFDIAFCAMPTIRAALDGAKVMFVMSSGLRRGASWATSHGLRIIQT